MSSTIAQPEAIAHAVLEKPPVAPPPPGSLQEAAVKIREKLNEGGSRSALESMRQRKPIEQRKIDELIDTNCGIERNADGTKKRPAGLEVKRRFDEMQKYAKLSKDFLEKGYDGLDVGQKPIVRTLVEQAVRAWPEADALFSGPPPMPPAEKEAIIETMLKDPKFAEKARSIFEGIIDPAKALKDTVFEAKTALEEARRKEGERKNEITKNNNEKALVNTELEQFKDGGGVGDGQKLQQIKAIEAELPTLKANLITKEDQSAEVQDRIKDSESQRRVTLQRGLDTIPIDAELMTKRSEARTLQREIKEINDRINLKTELEQERTSLEQKKQNLEEEKMRLDAELRSLTQERFASQANFSSAQLARTSEEMDFAGSLKDVFSETTMQFMEERIASAEEVQRKLIEEERAKTTDPDEQKILDALKIRWDQENWKNGRRSYKINKFQVKEDYGNLIVEGPKRILKDILLANSGFTAGTPAYAVEAARIDAKLTDLAFVEKMQQKVVERVITRQIQVGKVTEDDVRILRESDWGKGVVQNAIKNKAELRSEIEQLYGQGALETTFWEKLKRTSNGNFLKLLLLLLGTVALVVPVGMAIKSTLEE